MTSVFLFWERPSSSWRGSKLVESRPSLILLARKASKQRLKKAPSVCLPEGDKSLARLRQTRVNTAGRKNTSEAVPKGLDESSPVRSAGLAF
jgi:hypothetical protein